MITKMGSSSSPMASRREIPAAFAENEVRQPGRIADDARHGDSRDEEGNRE